MSRPPRALLSLVGLKRPSNGCNEPMMPCTSRKKPGANCAHWMDGSEAKANQTLGQFDRRIRHHRQHSLERIRNSPAKHAAKAKSGDNQGRTMLTPDTHEIDLGIGPRHELNLPGKADPSAFAYLPDRETLGVSFNELRGRTQSSVAVPYCRWRFAATSWRPRQVA